jgi:hypothetical protein
LGKGGKKKKGNTLLEEHMTDTQRARSNSNLPQVVDAPIMQGSVQLQLGKTYYSQQTKKMLDSRGNTINSIAPKPPLFEKPSVLKAKDGNRDGS